MPPREAARAPTTARRKIPLFTRVFLTNAAVLSAAVTFLAISPVTVSRPAALREVLVLLAGLCLILVLNLILFRRAFAPLERLTGLMATIDVLRPGRRIPVSGGDVEVTKLAVAFNEMIDRLEEERRQSAHRALSAQEGERSRVARELHDEIGQSLTALVLELDVLARSAPEHIRRQLVEVREAARRSLEEVRHIAQRLRPEALDELGLPAALAALADRVSGQGGVRVSHRVDARLPRLTSEAELVIYRVAQEGLTNTLRHAEAREAHMTLKGDAEGVVLRVRDNGRGLDGSVAGAGIQGMRERALLAGADLEISTRPEGGAEIYLAVPALVGSD